MCSSKLSPAGRYQRSPGHNGHATVIIKSPSPETTLKALSAESLRSVSPGSDSVFYSEGADQPFGTPHCHHCGREVSFFSPLFFLFLLHLFLFFFRIIFTAFFFFNFKVAEDIVQPPAGFADSPESHRTTPKHATPRLYKKFDKRYRSEDRGERRHHRSTGGRSDVRAKSEERGGRPSSRGSVEDGTRRRLQARSTDASLEIITGQFL